MVISTAQLHSTKPGLSFALAQIQLAAGQIFVMVRISDSGPSWKSGLLPFFSLPFHKINSSSSSILVFLAIYNALSHTTLSEGVFLAESL